MQMTGTADIGRCSNAKCPLIDASVCELFIPPGACCPQCGSALRLVYSKRDVVNHKKYISPVSIAVKDIVRHLRQQLQVVSVFEFPTFYNIFFKEKLSLYNYPLPICKNIYL